MTEVWVPDHGLGKDAHGPSRDKTAKAAVALYNKGSESAGSAAAISFRFAEIPEFVIPGQRNGAAGAAVEVTDV